jgi:hypothetical protein
MMTEASSLGEYLEFTNGAWRDLAKANGEEPVSWKLRHTDVLERLGRRFPDMRGAKEDEAGTIKECYSNVFSWVARHIVDGDGEWAYFEGLAESVIPLCHAWTVNKKTGEAVDLTWCEANGISLGVDYVGLEIPLEVVVWLSEKFETSGVMDNWWLLTDEMRDFVIQHNPTNKRRAACQ